MRKSAPLRRRLLFGLSVEDAQGKFDTPESRAALQLAHERYNKGIYHELQNAQRLRQQLSPSQKLHITRHTKPSVRGFQAYGKINADDYVVQELCWTCLSERERQRQEQLRLALGEDPETGHEQDELTSAPNTPVLVPVTEIGDREVVEPPSAIPEESAPSEQEADSEEALARQQMLLDEDTVDPISASNEDATMTEKDGDVDHDEANASQQDSTTALSADVEDPSALQSVPPPSASNRVEAFRQEQDMYHQHRAIIIASMEEALDSMTEAVSEELLKKRRRHSVEGAGALFSPFPPPSPVSPPPSASATSNTSSSLLYTSDLVSSSASEALAYDAGASPEDNEEAFLRSTSYPRHPHQHQNHPDHANLVDRLVEEMVSAQEHGYKPLSHLSAWFDPIQLRVVLNEEEAAAEADDEDDEETYVKENGEPLSEEELEAVRSQREEERLERLENARRVEDAFHSPYIAIPVAVDNVSFSLYVAGGLIRNELLMKEFPYHIARFFVSGNHQINEEADAGTKGKKKKKNARGKQNQPPPPPPPAAEVEVYFSAELYRVAKLTGTEGIHALRHFIGRAMQAQHSPTSLSQSILLNPSASSASGEEGKAFPSTVSGVHSVHAHPTAIRIPWKNTSFSSSPLQNSDNAAGLTEEERDGGLSMDRKRDAVQAVWRAWGHLVKDLHVYGDLDYLYVRIHQQQDKKETAAYIRGVQEWATHGELRQFQDISGSTVLDGSSVEGELDPLVGLGDEGEEALLTSGKRRVKRNKKQEDWMGRPSSQRIQLPITADFTVVECVLEKRGLPHHVVMEDLTDTLKRLQEESTTVMRLAVMDEWALQQQRQPQPSTANGSRAARGTGSGSSEEGADLTGDGEVNEHRGISSRESDYQSGPQLLPIVYSPKVTVSHAGVVERGSAHTFQRIRIRGSQLAHVQALAEALAEGTHFTSRENPIRVGEAELDEEDLPPNLSFSPLRAAQANAQYRQRRRNRHGHGDASPLGPRLPPTRKAWESRKTLTWSNESSGSGTSNGGHNRNEYGEAESDDPNAVAGMSEEEYGVGEPSMASESIVPMTEEEREFWKTHYYKLSNIRLIFYDRVDSHDVLNANSPRRTACVSKLLEELRSAEEIQEQEREERGESGRSRKSSRKKTKKRSRPQTFSTEQIFHQLCVDVEREAARFDLFPGDCPGYQYWMRLRKLRKEETPAVTKALQSVRHKGFINYFSPHRFSSCTHMDRHPGLALLKGKFQSAASMLVQQIYIDAALRAEQARMKLPFSPHIAMSTPGKKYDALHAADFPTLRGQESRQAVLARASPMIHVLHNALQATQMLSSSSSGSYGNGDKEKMINRLDEDPCAEAFLQVLGLHPCRVLVHEFLAFVWNDLVNQRLQRYGTFAVLPGDLVRVPPRLQGWLPSSTLVDVDPGTVRQASKHCAGGEDMGQNSTAIVDLDQGGRTAVSSPLVYATRKSIAQNIFHWSDVVLPVPGADMLLPQNHTTDLYVLTLKRFGIPFNPEKREWDLLSAEGNALGLRVSAQYRSVLVNPANEAYRFAASLQPGMVGDPYQRWGEAVRAVLSPPPLLPPSSSLGGGAVAGGVGVSPQMHPFLWHEEGNSAQDAGTALLAGGGPSTPSSSSTHNNNNNNHNNNKTLVLPFFTNKDTFKPKTTGEVRQRRPRHRPLPLPAYPYWYPQHNDGALDISIRLPTGNSPWMMIREMTKSDVSQSDVVQLQDEVREEDKRQERSGAFNAGMSASETAMTDAERAAKRWRKEQQRRVFQARPVATSLALLHQHIFRSSGVRRSLLPTLRSYDSVSK